MNFLKKYSEWMLVLIIPALFLLVSVLTIGDYGMNWDEPYHFMRGQAYLHFFMTGEKDYGNLPDFPRLSETCADWVPDCSLTPSPSDTESFRGDGRLYEEALVAKHGEKYFDRSLFQYYIYDYNYMIANDQGHPPINGILAALTNGIFFQKLHVLGDLESHQLFEILSSFILVVGVSIFTYRKFGIFVSLLSAFALSSYPLFFAESHFNIKDPVETSFFGLTIILFYFGITKNKWKLLVLSSVFAGLSLGTKFNALFLPLVIAPWLIFYIYNTYNRKTKKFDKKELRNYLTTFLSLVIYPVIVLVIFYSFWPYLWQDPIGGLLTIVDYYRGIGGGVPADMQNYLVGGWNSYPLIWIVYTTPIPVLILFVVGLFRSFYETFFKKEDVYLLLILWFLIPILRVSVPGTVIYGGVRQIMEYVPAMAIVAGIGGKYIVDISKSFFGNKGRSVATVVIVLSGFFVARELIAIHPNQNVYFNQLVGGLSGARERNIPSWGNTYGNVYRQGINWLNENAEPSSKLSLAVATMGNISKLKIRSDMQLYNGYWSGANYNGEYVIEMIYDWSPARLYKYAYFDTFMDPVYVVEVDGVPLLKIWKNDQEYVKQNMSNPINLAFILKKTGSKFVLDIGKESFLTEVIIFPHNSKCSEAVTGGILEYSVNGQDWISGVERIGDLQIPSEAVGIITSDMVPDIDRIPYFLTAKGARYVAITPATDGVCDLNGIGLEVIGLYND